jgi:hypothetical protein
MSSIKIFRGQAPGESDYRVFNQSVNDYTGSSNVIREDGCLAIMVSNIGDTMARFNGAFLFPSTTPLLSRGDSLVIGGHELDLYKGNLSLSFDVAGSAYPVGTNPHVQIIQLFYAKY